ncbi:MAG: GNAT family N-acetyltransferase [Acholeplasmatales bacterium]|nr:GNAT family N-acetyltransferase [Acholeplasmatales bacterium]
MENNIINSIEYKKYNSSYEDEVINIFVKAFENYPLFEIVKNDFKTEEKFHKFYNSFMKSLFKATIRKNECYIGINNGNVIDLVIIDAPTDKPVGFLDYVLCGGIKPILKLGLFNALKYLKLSDETENVVKSIKEPRFHLYFLVVDPKYQGLGVGSDAINNFLIPFVKEKNGKLITVTTNASQNINFYSNNGFSLIKEETLKYKDRTVNNWSFRMDL